jgi:hypothetical protein
VTLRARWVTLRARWVTLRARWVTLRARWVTFQIAEARVAFAASDRERAHAQEAERRLVAQSDAERREIELRVRQQLPASTLSSTDSWIPFQHQLYPAPTPGSPQLPASTLSSTYPWINSIQHRPLST